MAERSPGELLAILVDIERRSRAHAAGLPQQDEIKSYWSGIGFRLADNLLLAPLSDVFEILHYPSMTRVPGTKPWVRGIANIRGTLLPIMDLRGFLGGQPVPVHKTSRVLMVGQPGRYAGLVVDEVFGLKHFSEDERVAAPPDADELVRMHVRTAFERDGELWRGFALRELADSAPFMHVAA